MVLFNGLFDGRLQLRVHAPGGAERGPLQVYPLLALHHQLHRVPAFKAEQAFGFLLLTRALWVSKSERSVWMVSSARRERFHWGWSLRVRRSHSPATACHLSTVSSA